MLGVITGTLINIDGAINKLASMVEAKFKKDGTFFPTHLCVGTIS